MSLTWLLRWGAVSGVILGLSIAVPGAIEAFTGETALTSFIIGFGVVFGAPALTGLYLRQSARAGRFGAIAYAVNLIGLGLFASVAFALNLVVFYLDTAVIEDLLDGPTRIALLASTVVFVAGTILFAISMLRTRLFPTISAVGYGLLLSSLALLAPLPDSVITSGIHILAGLALIHLSISLWSAPAPEQARPTTVPAIN